MLSLFALATPMGISSLIALWAGYRIVVALYNISPFHPLARFPGPKSAAFSYLYEMYYDLWLGGMFTREIKRLHDLYGTCK